MTERLRAYVNIEAIVRPVPLILFETGPGTRWLVSPWHDGAASPRRFVRESSVPRLPNDTDFSIIKRHDIPGLNFAPIETATLITRRATRRNGSRRSPSAKPQNGRGNW